MYNRILFNHKISRKYSHLWHIHKPGGHCLKWIKSEKDKYHMISLICWIWKNSEHTERVDWWLQKEWGGSSGWWGISGDCQSQRVQTPSYKMHKFWVSTEYHSDSSQQYYILYTWNLPREYILKVLAIHTHTHTHKRKLWCNRCVN